MNRLTVLFPLVISALTIPVPISSVNAQDAHYTIAGDVAQPDTYAFPAGQPVHLLDLLQSSGTQLPEGTAIIVHDSPQSTAGSERVRPGQTDRGSLLTPGDVAIFHGTDVRTEAGNVVLLTDDLPITLRFKGASGNVAKLLEGVQTVVPPDTAIPVIRTDQGRSQSVQLTASDQALHGDVLVLWSVIQVSGMRITEQFSDQSASLARTSPADSAAAGVVPPAERLPGPRTNASHLQTVDPVARPGTALVTTAAYQAETGDRGLLFPVLSDENNEGQPAPDLQPTSGMSGSRPVALDSGSGVTSPQAAEAAAVAAALGDVDATMDDRSHGSSFWSILLIVGMPISLGLVVAGWLRTRGGQEPQADGSSPLLSPVDKITSWLRSKSERARLWRTQPDHGQPELLAAHSPDITAAASSAQQLTGTAAQPTPDAGTPTHAENHLDRALNLLRHPAGS